MGWGRTWLQTMKLSLTPSSIVLRTLVVAEFDGGVIMCADTRTSTGSIQRQIHWVDLLGCKPSIYVCDQTL